MSDAHDPNVNTEPDNVDVGLIATITVVGALLVVAIAAALTALVRVEQEKTSDRAGAQANLGAIQRMRNEQTDKLNAPPKWTDKAEGLVSIPIDRAMTLVSADIRRNPALATPEAPAGEEVAADAGTATGTSGDAGTAQEQDMNKEAAPIPQPGEVEEDEAPKTSEAASPRTPPAPKASGRTTTNGAKAPTAPVAPKPPQQQPPPAPTAGETGGQE